MSRTTSTTTSQAVPVVDVPMSAPTHEQFAVDLATTKAHLNGLGQDVHEQGLKIGSLEAEVRRGFQQITADVSRGLSTITQDLNRVSQPKPMQWQMVSVFLVMLLALGSWANSYFGQGIAAAAKEAQMAQEKWSAVNGRIDLISTRQHTDSLAGAHDQGYQKAISQAGEKERDRMRLEIDRLTDARKTP